MSVCLPHTPFWFCICLAVVLITSFIMSRQSRKFFYFDGVKKKFSILNLELPANRFSIKMLITKIRVLPGSESSTVFKALRGQLYVDFLFMPATYIGVLLLCMAAACQLQGLKEDFFVWLAWLQLLAWSLDIIENIFLLQQIKQPTELSAFSFGAYRLLEIFKWGLACLGFLLSAATIIYHAIYLK